LRFGRRECSSLKRVDDLAARAAPRRRAAEASGRAQSDLAANDWQDLVRDVDGVATAREAERIRIRAIARRCASRGRCSARKSPEFLYFQPMQRNG
jgi:hypothetical protein